MKEKLFEFYMKILNSNRGVSFYLIIVLIIQISCVILVAPNLIPYFDKAVIVYINLSYLLVLLFTLKLFFLLYKNFKDHIILLRLFYTLLSSSFLVIWVLVSYALTSLAVGQGVFGPKLIHEYEVPQYNKRLYIYRDIVFDTSITIMQRVDKSPFLDKVQVIKHTYGNNIKGFRFDDRFEVQIDTFFCQFDLLNNNSRVSKKSILNKYAAEEIFPVKVLDK